MRTSLRLRTFQIGARPRRGDGLRIGATRRPPRGVAKVRWQPDGYFDVWLPTIAPSAALLSRYKRRNWDDKAVRDSFFDAYERELSRPPARHAVALLAAVARRTPVSVGCFCGDETRCHHSRLLAMLRRTAVDLL